MVTVAELEPQTVADEIVLEIVAKKIETIETSRFSGTMARCTARDETGEITLSLWGEQVDEFQIGDTIKIVNGWIRQWQDEKIVTKGRGGSITLVKRTKAEEEE